jgi:hypothetical protein
VELIRKDKEKFRSAREILPNENQLNDEKHVIQSLIFMIMKKLRSYTPTN